MAKKSSTKNKTATQNHKLAPKQGPQDETEAVTARLDFPRAGFMRRLAAMIYDALVAVAVGMVAALVLLVIFTICHSNGLIGQQHDHLSDFMQTSKIYTTILQIWVAVWVLGFFLWFWAKGGQTIGMRAWRMRIFSTVEAPMTMGRLCLRLVSSLGGLGTLLVLLDFKNKQSLQDRLAKTEILVLTKDANDHKQWR